jgi:N-acetylmuramoyl-L-alanine amidase
VKQNAKTIFFLGLLSIIIVVCFPVIKTQKTGGEAAVREFASLTNILEKRKNYFNIPQDRTADRLVNILIVPGHDDEHWGAQFKKTKEVELNRIVAQKLFDYLSREEGINPVLASDTKGYNPIFENYFNREKSAIEEFIKSSKENFSEKINEEDFKDVEKNFHNVAPDDVIYRLYGINQWVNNQKFDLVIHVHFNDYAGRKSTKAGKYDGFSIYTPGKLFSNYDVSRKLADNVFNELKKVRPVSSLEEEQIGVIEDHELIALGANESLDAGSILIEYGYIYEPLFLDTKLRDIALDYFAYATYSGIKKMLNENPASKEIQNVQVSKNKTTQANLIWQFNHGLEGAYPPKNKTLRDCPILGYFGKCSQMVK